MLLCVAPLVAHARVASNQLLEAEQLRRRGKPRGRAAAAPRRHPAPASAASTVELARIAARKRRRTCARGRAGPDRPPAGPRSSSAWAPIPRPSSIGVLSATVTDGDALARALATTARGLLERDGRLKIAADPYDSSIRTRATVHVVYRRGRAGTPITAAGGGSRAPVAVIDSGLDVEPSGVIGRIAHTFDTATKGRDMTDKVGHGTFVTGLIRDRTETASAERAWRRQHEGAGRPAPREPTGTPPPDLLRGILYSISRRRRRGVLSHDVWPRGRRAETPQRSRAPWRAGAARQRRLPVAASGNTGTEGNAPQFPAAVLGGRAARPGSGCRSAPPIRTGSPRTSQPTTS